MRREARSWVQLATRIPAELRRRAKLAAIVGDVTLQDFVIAAIQERLAREAGAASPDPGAERADGRPAPDADVFLHVPPPLLMQAG